MRYISRLIRVNQSCIQVVWTEGARQVKPNEVAKKLEISTETLYKYERYFSLKIRRNEDNNRIYEDKDIEIFQNILELKERGLGLAQIKGIVDKTVEVAERKIDVLKNSNFDKFQGKDFEIIVQNIINNSLEGTGKQIGALQGDVSAGFNDITQRMDAILKQQNEMLKQQSVMLKRQDEIIEGKDKKVIELEEKNKQLRDENTRLKNLKWWQRKKQV